MRINRTIRLLMISDIFVMTGFGLVEPVIAVFIKDNLIGGTIFAAGIASTLFLITKSVIQLPFSRYVDAHAGRSDLKWLTVGTFIVAATPFIYIFSKHIYHIYIAQILYGIGSGLAYPAWLGIWSTHLDKNQESFEWSLYSTLVSVGTAIAATVGAAIAEFIGFVFTFVFVGVMSLIGCFVLFALRRKLPPRSVLASQTIQGLAKKNLKS